MWSFKHNKLQLWSENVSCYLISKVKTYLFQNCPECPRNNKSPRLTWVFNVYSTWDIHITLVQACNLTFVNMKSIMLPSPYLTPCGHWLPRNIQRAHYTKNNITFQHVCYYAHFWTDIKNAFATQFSTRLTQKLLKEMKHWHEFWELISTQLLRQIGSGSQNSC